jgi:hypothetical protein
MKNFRSHLNAQNISCVSIFAKLFKENEILKAKHKQYEQKQRRKSNSSLKKCSNPKKQEGND